jgi:peptide/nickel transport system substrate-binding protein
MAAAVGLGVLGSASGAPAHYGGTIVVALTGGDPGSLDPTVGGNGSARPVINALCLRLYEYALNHGKAELADPILAAAPPQISADRLTYTIELRQGIEFNDGTPFNAQAVIATYQRYITYPGSIWMADFANVRSVTATGPYTVVYHLKQRNSTFLGNMYVLSPTALTKEGANFAANPICVSPFMFDHSDPGVDVTLVKSPYYYKRNAVYLDKIVFKPMTDGPAAVAALQAGDVQMINGLDPTLVSAVEQDSKLKVVSAPAFNVNGMKINIGNKNGTQSFPYTNVGTPLAARAKLRQGFEEAIDRNTMNKVVFDGRDKPSCTLIPPSDTLWYAATKVPCTPYGPADAKRLVAASGYSTPITVHLLTSNGTQNVLLAQFIQSEEAAVGFNVVIDTAGSVSIANGLAGSGRFDVLLSGYQPDPDPNILISNNLDTNGPGDFSGYSNPRLDYVLANGLKASSLAARAVDYHVAQEIIHDDRPLIVLYNSVAFAAYDASALTGVELTALATLSLVNAQYK